MDRRRFKLTIFPIKLTATFTKQPQQFTRETQVQRPSQEVPFKIVLFTLNKIGTIHLNGRDNAIVKRFQKIVLAFFLICVIYKILAYLLGNVTLPLTCDGACAVVRLSGDVSCGSAIHESKLYEVSIWAAFNFKLMYFISNRSLSSENTMFE